LGKPFQTLNPLRPPFSPGFNKTPRGTPTWVIRRNLGKKVNGFKLGKNPFLKLLKRTSQKEVKNWEFSPKSSLKTPFQGKQGT